MLWVATWPIIVLTSLSLQGTEFDDAALLQPGQQEGMGDGEGGEEIVDAAELEAKMQRVATWLSGQKTEDKAAQEEAGRNEESGTIAAGALLPCKQVAGCPLHFFSSFAFCTTCCTA